MDKFAILKLLTSLFDFYKQKSTKNSEGQQGGLDVDSLLSPLKNMIKNGENSSLKVDSPRESEKKAPTPAPTRAPLQSKMLSVIASHDQIVERVKNNANKHSSHDSL